jgi:predicted nucleic acid-binding protein
VVIVADSSAWIEYLRGTGSEVAARVRAHHDLSDGLAVTETVVMELYAGVRNAGEQRNVDTIVRGSTLLPIGGLPDHEHAAALYRTCRRHGETIRRMSDCLIAALAIRNDVPVLHNDADFDVLARHTPLQIA